MHRTVLDNGLRLLSEEVPGMPSVTVGIWVENGSRDEAQHENGLSHFLEHLFFKGTNRRSAAAIAEEVDAIGGVLDAFTGKEYTCYYARVLAADMPLALDLLTDVFLHSQFPEEEIERERSVICQEIAQIEDTPDDLGMTLFISIFGADIPCWPISGTTATVSRFQREDFVKFLDRRYRPDRHFCDDGGRGKTRKVCRLYRGGIFHTDGEVDQFLRVSSDRAARRVSPSARLRTNAFVFWRFVCVSSGA